MKYFKKNKRLLLFLIIILVMGFILGIIFGLMQKSEFKEIIITNKENIKAALLNNNINNIGEHLVWLGLLIISNLLLPFYLVSIGYLFFTSFSMGFSISLLGYAFGLKGLIFSILYNSVTKLFFLVLFLFLLIKLFYIGKHLLGYIIYKNRILKKYIIKNITVALMIVGIIALIDTFLYFMSINILKVLGTML